MTLTGCRHAADEPEPERVGREAAVSLVRAVIASQAAFLARTAGYGQLAELEGVPFVPAGWAS
jgi:hypothetical protein